MSDKSLKLADCGSAGSNVNQIAEAANRDTDGKSCAGHCNHLTKALNVFD